ncbi:2-aminoadipate transaminase [Caprobacter fermentans]|uniref:2-aminoadipate transaminase n=1 Tax=Caproicibacter fermentans TaxID=2576756 RepID=A0A6N8I0Z5_9FIRM|nr:PLP-dependent aminotransferase family protein [Caproicibacter fermentans]MVB11794.1 2-aminoadipate transaminase [Caproicibacter fermentans]OCN00784.1 aspartate aminotransferase [Clostridium sp. W14A]
MNLRLADRMENAINPFISDILRATARKDLISFGGGLPNPASFPVREISEAAQKVLSEDGAGALQYSTAEGYPPLRELIAARYQKRFGITVDPADILMTTGSQQGLDLLAKLFLNKGDDLLIERPGYLGAIQAFNIYQPNYHAVPLRKDGADTDVLEEILKSCSPKLFYAVPNFQNPSGLTYSEQNRKRVAELMKKSGTIFVEDDPYGELRFAGSEMPCMKSFLGEDVIMLGTFSKIISPAIRLGWVCAKPEIMKYLVAAKQAADIHSDYFAERVVCQYLQDNDLDAHIEKIRTMYQERKNCMVEMARRYFPQDVSFTDPEGGMFMWVTLPEGMSAVELNKIAAEKNVAFVPGDPFYVGERNVNTFRMSYTNSDANVIEKGIRCLGDAMREMTASR